MAASPEHAERSEGDSENARLSAFVSDDERETWPDPADEWRALPWNDPDELDRLYNDEGLSTAKIASDAFGGRVSSELVRRRLHDHDIMPPFGERENGTGDPYKNIRKLEGKADDVGSDVPDGDDSYKKFTLAGSEGDQ